MENILALYIMEEKKQKISKRIRTVISEIDKEAEIILFGSRARGDEHNNSDWDILVITSSKADFALEKKFRDSIYDIELDTGEVLSLLVYSKLDWKQRQNISPFYQNVLKEGIVL